MTGAGVRQTLEILSEWLPLDITEVPSGTQILDWTVPLEWNVNEAWIKRPDGSKLVDFSESNLHLVAYSTPVSRTMPLGELQDHLYSRPDLPDAIPYRTGYFDESWGFCLADSVRAELVDGDYEVFIDATLDSGTLTYGEFFKPGTSDREILLFAHVCHPSLVNDNLSGIAVGAAYGRSIINDPPGEYGVRILFAPATVGSIAWLAANRDAIDRVIGGMTLVCLGDEAPLRYKKTAGGDERIDRVASDVIAREPFVGSTMDFYPFGYDERQFNSPGFRIPIGSLMRSQHGTFPEYHTSLDTPDFVSEVQLMSALEGVEAIVRQMQNDRRFRNLAPRGEPQLGVRGLYESVQNAAEPREMQYAFLWILNMSDDEHGLREITEKSGIALEVLEEAAAILVAHGLLEELDQHPS
jgi:aminopeptidase-like protein